MEKILTRLLSFLVVLGVIFVFLHVSVVKAPDVLFSCDPSKIESFMLKSDDDEVEVRRAPEKWFWTLQGRHLNALADNQTVEALTKYFCGLRFIEKYDLQDGSNMDLSTYGLSDPKLKMGAKLDAKEVWISIGNESVSDTEFYVASSETPDTVFLVSDKYRFLQTLHFFDVRSKTVFDIPRLKRVTLKIQGETIRFNRKPSNLWDSDNPSFDEASIKKIVDLLGIVTYIRYLKVTDAQELNKYGFFLPDLVIEVEDENATQTEYVLTKNLNNFRLKFLYGQNPYILFLYHQPMMELYKLLENLVFNYSAGG